MFKVLLFEEEKYTRKFLNKLINEIPGITEIFVTSSSNDAISWAENNKPQLLVLDLEPGENNSSGLIVAKAIYTINKDAYVVFVTGYSENARQSLKVYPCNNVLKPININIFKKQIAEFIDNIENQSKLNIN